MDIPWILVSIAIGIVILAITFVLVMKRGGWNREVDYKGYFNMGIIWFPLGIVFYLIFKNIIGVWFLIIGLVYLVIGLKNKDKWGKPQKLSPTHQKIMTISLVIGVIALALGIIIFELMT